MGEAYAPHVTLYDGLSLARAELPDFAAVALPFARLALSQPFFMVRPLDDGDAT